MKYPNVTLKIRQYVPTIEYSLDDQVVKKLYTLDKGLDTLLMEAASSVHFAYNDVNDIFALIRTGMENFLEFPEIDYEGEELNSHYISEQLHTALVEREAAAGLDPEVGNALNEFWQADVLASVLEEVYALLIAKTVFSASELGIGTIILDDDMHEIRLHEKVGKEMGAVPEIELIVV